MVVAIFSATLVLGTVEAGLTGIPSVNNQRAFAQEVCEWYDPTCVGDYVGDDEAATTPPSDEVLASVPEGEPKYCDPNQQTGCLATDYIYDANSGTIVCDGTQYDCSTYIYGFDIEYEDGQDAAAPVAASGNDTGGGEQPASEEGLSIPEGSMNAGLLESLDIKSSELEPTIGSFVDEVQKKLTPGEATLDEVTITAQKGDVSDCADVPAKKENMDPVAGPVDFRNEKIVDCGDDICIVQAGSVKECMRKEFYCVEPSEEEARECRIKCAEKGGLCSLVPVGPICGGAAQECDEACTDLPPGCPAPKPSEGEQNRCEKGGTLVPFGAGDPELDICIYNPQDAPKGVGCNVQTEGEHTGKVACQASPPVRIISQSQDNGPIQ